ncbi:MAG: class II aldolase/adducin family protein [Myxococcota bacterium]
MRAGRGLRQQVITTSRRLAERGWVANHDGNITVRLGDDHFLATPTATAKGEVAAGNLIEVDGRGAVVAGTARPFGELNLHMAIYQRRDDVRAVVHAHPPHATAVACSAGNPIERPFIAEAVVSIGAHIPKVPFAPPGPDAARALAAVVDDVDAALMANHGAIAWGADVEQAYLRLELVEHLARIAVVAQPLGGVVPLPASALPPLLAKRARAGLGRAAAKAEAAGAMRITNASGPDPAMGSPDLVRIIREEIARVTGKTE